MFIIANLLSALAQVFDVALTVFYWMILIRALLSWVNPDPYNAIVRFLDSMTEPVLARIRGVLPAALRFGIDISPIIAILGLLFLKSFLVRTLMDVSLRLRS